MIRFLEMGIILRVPLLLLLTTLDFLESTTTRTPLSAKGGADDSSTLVNYTGVPAKTEDHPYLVSLHIKGKYLCGGVILDKDVILTVAHCLNINGTKPEHIAIFAGGNSQEDDILSSQVLGSSTFVIHPNFTYDKESNRLENDIALVVTSGRFKWTKHVQPRSIHTDWEDQVGIDVTLALWGKTEKSQSLMEINLVTTSHHMCRKYYKNYLPENNFCTFSKGKDWCGGYGGTPVVTKNGDLIGLMSFSSRQCGAGPSVNVKISKYQSWMDDQLKVMNQKCQENGISDSNLDSSALFRIFRSTRKALEICGPRWKLWCENNDCYCYLFLRKSLTWREADKHCEVYGGALVTIKSREENEFVAEYVNVRSSRLWIGLNDIKNEGQYVWQKGEKPNYLAWKAGEPNRVTEYEDCVEMLPNMKWNDQECSLKLHSVCKVPIDRPYRNCRQSWAFYNTNCYRISSVVSTWDEAIESCRQSGAELASVLTADENNFIRSLLSDGSDEYFWLGLSRTSAESYEWADKSTVSYRNWDWFQPNGGLEKCVALQKNSGMWHDFVCGTLFFSVCKMSAN